MSAAHVILLEHNPNDINVSYLTLLTLLPPMFVTQPMEHIAFIDDDGGYYYYYFYYYYYYCSFIQVNQDSHHLVDCSNIQSLKVQTHWQIRAFSR
jgi:hypothetical protein